MVMGWVDREPTIQFLRNLTSEVMVFFGGKMYSLLLIHSTAICDNKRTLSVSRSDDNSFDCSHAVFSLGVCRKASGF